MKINPAPVEYSIPRCDDPVVIAQIGAEYRGRHWASGVTAVGMRAHKVSRKGWSQDMPPYWPQDMRRRFCEGTIELSGAYYLNYPIYYAIIPDGVSYQLEWCVVGLDRPWPYDQRCRLARP